MPSEPPGLRPPSRPRLGKPTPSKEPLTFSWTDHRVLGDRRGRAGDRRRAGRSLVGPWCFAGLFPPLSSVPSALREKQTGDARSPASGRSVMVIRLFKTGGLQSRALALQAAGI